jgi:hypothetical protein
MPIRCRLLKVRQDLRNDLGLLDAGDHPELPAAAGAPKSLTGPAPQPRLGGVGPKRGADMVSLHILNTV